MYGMEVSMYDFRRCVLGVAPTRRDMFPKSRVTEIYDRVKQLAEKYDVELVTIEDLVPDGLLVNNSDIPAIVKHFIANDVDAVFIPHANFGQEEAAAKLCAAMGKPVLLWGPRDPAPLGVVNQQEDRLYDVQCGLFATGKALLSYDVPFTYLENCWIDSDILDKGFDRFIRVVCAVKAFKGARIAQLSTRPWQFTTVKVNENEILERFGIEVVPFESSEVISAIQAVLDDQGDLIDETIAEWKQTIDLSTESDETVRKMAASVIGIRQLAEKNGCRAIAGECWKMLRAAFGVSACFIWGMLTNEKLPVTCETDIMGAIGSCMLLGATRGETPPFFADITVRHPEDENAELLWHCGPFPPSLAKPGTTPAVIGCKGQFEIKGGDLTLVRMGWAKGRYTMFADEVVGTDGPKTNGTYIWVKTNDWPAWEEKFVTGPYIHHVSGAHGKYRSIIHEALKYVGDIHPDFVE